MRSGVKQLDVRQLFAGPDELDGLACGVGDGQGRAAAGVAVQLGQDHAADVQRLVELIGHVDRFLAGHAIHHQQNFGGVDHVADVHQLLHQELVDLQPASGVHEDQVVALSRPLR